MNPSPSANDFSALMEELSPFLGTWRGTGAGGFPTIAPFQYDEELVFESNSIEALIHYEQKTNWAKSSHHGDRENADLATTFAGAA